jgi:transposase InsO family protein
MRIKCQEGDLTPSWWGRDLFDRKVIGWALGADVETAHTTIPAVEMACANRQARTGLIFHPGRRVQYCAESFFKTLKRELETLDGRHTEAEVRGSVFMYLEA